MNTPSTSISPGLGGFLAFFVLAIALWLLMRNMNARMRRMSYRAEEEARRAEEARRRGEAGPPHPAPERDGPAEQADAGPGPEGKRQTGASGGEQTGDSRPE